MHVVQRFDAQAGRTRHADFTRLQLACLFNVFQSVMVCFQTFSLQVNLEAHVWRGMGRLF
jgi:hypothetical protein